MNVTCPQCATVFRVDPAKVPERGIRARCSVCSGLIAVRRPPPAPPTVGGDLSATTAIRPAPAPASAPPASLAVAPRVAAPVPPPPPAPSVFAAPPPIPPAPAPRAPGRFSNPFLQQDPATRARRLARALVSDLVVYHPEKRQRGLRDGNLKELFAEEIRKSWEEYSEQIGEEFAGATPYFTEALNEILAEGKPLFG